MNPNANDTMPLAANQYNNTFAMIALSRERIHKRSRAGRIGTLHGIRKEGNTKEYWWAITAGHITILRFGVSCAVLGSPDRFRPYDSG